MSTVVILWQTIFARILASSVSIPVASAANVVAAPLAAVFTEYNQESKQQERFAFVKSGDDWVRRIITIGVSDYFFAEVTSGLKAGDVVSLEDKTKTAIKSDKKVGVTRL